MHLAVLFSEMAISLEMSTNCFFVFNKYRPINTGHVLGSFRMRILRRFRLISVPYRYPVFRSSQIVVNRKIYLKYRTLSPPPSPHQLTAHVYGGSFNDEQYTENFMM